MSSNPDRPRLILPEDCPRRNFLSLTTTASVVTGAAFCAWPFLKSLSSSGDIDIPIPVDTDLLGIASGPQLLILWHNLPIFIVHRTEEALKNLSDPGLLMKLRDAASHTRQQPSYTTNWHRSIQPRFGVMVGICTHLGCIPTYDPTKQHQGGYHCACHGSKFDLAGRVFKGGPAPYNLPIPPYRFIDSTSLRIGENPPGQSFSLESVTQL